METEAKTKKRSGLVIPLVLFAGIFLAMLVNSLYLNSKTISNVETTLSSSLNERIESINAKVRYEYSALDLLAYTLIQNNVLSGSEEDREKSQQIFSRFESKSSIESIDIIFMDGTTLLGEESRIKDPINSTFFKKGLSGVKTAGIVRDTSDNPRLAVSMPYRNDDMETVGVIVAISTYEDTSKMFISSGNYDQSFIVDKYGNFVMGSLSSEFVSDANANSGKINIITKLNSAAFKKGKLNTFIKDIEDGNSGFIEYKLNGYHKFASYKALAFGEWTLIDVASFDLATSTLMANRSTDIATLIFIIVYAALIFIYVYFEHLKEKNRLIDEANTLRYMAEHDDLTGLVLRRVFCDKVKSLIYSTSLVDYMLVVLDIEKFKAINDKYGRTRGDELLKYMAVGIRNYAEKVRGYSTRLFADYFAICAPYSKSSVEQLINYLNRHAAYSGLPFDIYLTFGIYRIYDRDESVDSMIERASIAEKAVKERYLSRFGEYDDKLRSEMLYEQWVTGIMKTALEEKEFKLYVQPQYDYNGDCIGSGEALVRWHRPDGGRISPSVFIPLFEKNGFVTKIDCFIWEEAIKLVSEMLHSGNNYVPLSVNISRTDFDKDDIKEEILDLIEKYEVPIELIRLEITESAYITDGNRILNKVKEFSDAGFTVEIDDFGSGYSSLNVLRDMPADVLKTDLKFLYGYQEDSSGSVILKHVMAMSSELGMSVVAEGVETKEQADFLHEVGCNIMQGYYYSKPIPSEKFKELVALDVKLPLERNTYYDQETGELVPAAIPLSVETEAEP